MWFRGVRTIWFLSSSNRFVCPFPPPPSPQSRVSAKLVSFRITAKTETETSFDTSWNELLVSVCFVSVRNSQFFFVSTESKCSNTNKANISLTETNVVRLVVVLNWDNKKRFSNTPEQTLLLSQQHPFRSLPIKLFSSLPFHSPNHFHDTCHQCNGRCMKIISFCGGWVSRFPITGFDPRHLYLAIFSRHIHPLKGEPGRGVGCPAVGNHLLGYVDAHHLPLGRKSVQTKTTFISIVTTSDGLPRLPSQPSASAAVVSPVPHPKSSTCTP